MPSPTRYPDGPICASSIASFSGSSLAAISARIAAFFASSVSRIEGTITRSRQSWMMNWQSSSTLAASIRSVGVRPAILAHSFAIASCGPRARGSARQAETARRAGCQPGWMGLSPLTEGRLSAGLDGPVTTHGGQAVSRARWASHHSPTGRSSARRRRAWGAVRKGARPPPSWHSSSRGRASRPA